MQHEAGQPKAVQGGAGMVGIVLAAGKGTRMTSALPKVLHAIAGRPMLHHVLASCAQAGAERIVTVVGAGGEQVAASARAFSPACAIAVQEPQLGTGHAVLAARASCPEAMDDALILYGDTPLIRMQTLADMCAVRRAGAAIVVLGFRPDDPGAYGRLILDGTGALEAIVEAREATPEQLALPLCNSGVLAVDGRVLFPLLDEIDNDNAKGEYYLTDIVAKARSRGLACAVVEAEEAEVLGVNARGELARAEAAYQARRRDEAMAAGVTLRDPSTVAFSWDTVLGRDVTIAPHVVFGPGAVVEDGVEIGPFNHIEGVTLPAGSRVPAFSGCGGGRGPVAPATADAGTRGSVPLGQSSDGGGSVP
ncbi:MAG: NTP transferase domain-containing protein [Alphaproteobacteria bacterium]